MYVEANQTRYIDRGVRRPRRLSLSRVRMLGDGSVMLAAIKRLLGRAEPFVPPVQRPSMIHLRRANARRYLRLRGITHIKGVYGAPI